MYDFFFSPVNIPKHYLSQPALIMSLIHMNAILSDFSSKCLWKFCVFVVFCLGVLNWFHCYTIITGLLFQLLLPLRPDTLMYLNIIAHQFLIVVQVVSVGESLHGAMRLVSRLPTAARFRAILAALFSQLFLVLCTKSPWECVYLFICYVYHKAMVYRNHGVKLVFIKCTKLNLIRREIRWSVDATVAVS